MVIRILYTEEIKIIIRDVILKMFSEAYSFTSKCLIISGSHFIGKEVAFKRKIRFNFLDSNEVLVYHWNQYDVASKKILPKSDRWGSWQRNQSFSIWIFFFIFFTLHSIWHNWDIFEYLIRSSIDMESKRLSFLWMGV